MTRRVTFDQLALGALMRNDQAELQRLNKLVQHAIGASCPECGAGHDQIEGNGDNSAFLCLACEWQWDADQEI